jgi:ABC-type uncharacterized transport system involved in gliding motility auxiliary subunit
LKSRTPDPEEQRGLVIAGPTEEIPAAELYKLDQYLMRGGALAVLVDGVTVEEGMEDLRGSANETGLDEILQTYGVQLNHDVVMDVQTDRFLLTKQVRTPLGMLPMSIPVAYPGWPHMAADLIDEEHPLLFRLPGLTLLWPSTVRITREAAENENIEARVLVRTSKEAWSQRDNFNLDPRNEEADWMSNREEAHRRAKSVGFPLVVELTGTFQSHWAGQSPPTGESGDEEEQEHLDESQTPGRILVVGDADFLRPQFVGSQRRPRHAPSNITFLMNILDWLAEDEDLIEVRAKRLEDPSVPEMSDSKRELIKWGNILAWPALFLIFGVVRWRVRAGRRRLAWDASSKRYVVKQSD